MVAPSADAVKRSLKNPNTLEMRIPKLLVKIAWNRDLFADLMVSYLVNFTLF